MKIAVPVMDGRYTVPLDKAAEFAVYTINHCVIQKREIFFPPLHEAGRLADWPHQLGVNLMIVGCMEQKRACSLDNDGLKILYNSPCLSPEELVQCYLKNNLN